ncbi:hypothetical protein CRG98_029530 [Punica granatum]|uniref:Uncharacterized protein n=1 Tax=Punica granatum TaxID=22663 RepID=A0A2I0J1I4_PUNGR|nr:hypothetical protein CRG98_029530 [Punica granatum]
MDSHTGGPVWQNVNAESLARPIPITLRARELISDRVALISQVSRVTPERIQHPNHQSQGLKHPHTPSARDLSASNPSAKWGLALSHHFDPSRIQAEDNSGRDVRSEVRQSFGSSTDPTDILRTIRSSWDPLVRSDSTLDSHKPVLHQFRFQSFQSHDERKRNISCTQTDWDLFVVICISFEGSKTHIDDDTEIVEVKYGGIRGDDPFVIAPQMSEQRGQGKKKARLEFRVRTVVRMAP